MESLPDALQVMAGDLRAGLTTDRAIVSAARPEFGPLKDELDKAARKITLGTEISVALKGMLIGIRSKRLKRTISLITNGLRSGGSLAPLLEQTAEDVRKQDLIDNKIRASVGMYTIFIFLAVAMASPLLFGLSTILVKVLSQIIGGIDIPSGASSTLPVTINPVNLKEDFLVFFISVFLVMNSFFGSLMLGMISKGQAKRGLVFFPVFLIFAFSTFFASKAILTSILGGLFGF